MGRRMNLLQLLDRDLGVNLGRAQLGMTQQLLDEPDVGPAFQLQGGAGVPEQVATATLATGQSLSGYIRHSASRAARPTREKGVHHSIVSPFVVQFAPRDWRDHLPIVRAVHSRRSESFRPETLSGQFARKRR